IFPLLGLLRKPLSPLIVRASLLDTAENTRFTKAVDCMPAGAVALLFAPHPRQGDERLPPVHRTYLVPFGRVRIPQRRDRSSSEFRFTLRRMLDEEAVSGSRLRRRAVGYS